MAIEVVYGNFEAAEGQDPGKLKRLMQRDASWGTHIENLRAAEETCGQGAQTRWKASEPTLNNREEGRSVDRWFTLEFPNENFRFATESVDHFVGTVAGDILQNPAMKSIVVRDFDFTDNSLSDSFPGPNVGIDGLYDELLSVTLRKVKRPILAFTLKPRLGMSVDDVTRIYKAAAASGIDIVEDDERLIDPPSCPFESRVEAVSRIQAKSNSLYSVNITADSQSALEKLDFCVEHGIRMVKIDVLVSGFETLRRVARKIKEVYDSSVAITVYPDAVGDYRRLDRNFILKLSRLCGADIIYAGSPNWARYLKEKGELKETVEPVYQRHRLLADHLDFAPEVKSTLPTITNDQHPSRAELVTAYFRKHKDGHYRYAFYVGGGISGFPSNIKTAVKVWTDCLRHAATANTTKYRRFDLSRYEEGLKENEWYPIDVGAALK